MVYWSFVNPLPCMELTRRWSQARWNSCKVVIDGCSMGAQVEVMLAIRSAKQACLPSVPDIPISIKPPSFISTPEHECVRVFSVTAATNGDQLFQDGTKWHRLPLAGAAYWPKIEDTTVG